MQRYFLRYLFYILTISVCVILVLFGVLAYQYKKSGQKWRNAIYASCLDALEANLNASTFPDLNIDGLSLFGSVARDPRISGYLVRDNEGAVLLTVGQTPDGEILAQFFEEDKVTEGKEVKTSTRRTTINVSSTTDNSFLISRGEVTIVKAKTFLPDFVESNDILGTIYLTFEDEPIISIDIICYSPRNYIYSRQIVEPIFGGIIFTLPLALLIAFIGAYVVSSRNTRYIDSVRVALRRLADGESGIEAPHFRHSDLNEIGRAISELDQSLLDNKRSRSTWLRSISHDLNTPVTAMKIIIDGLSDGFFDPDAETLSTLKRENDKLSDRIRRVIEYSTLIADTRIHEEEIEADAFIQSVRISLKDAGNVEFKSFSDNNETGNVRLVCDTAQMRRAVQELIDNARNSAQEGEKTVITVSAESATGKGSSTQYRITVQNPGSLPGDMDVNSLFEPWTKGTYSRSGAGNGLGLSIVGAIMALHGGTASIREDGGLVTATLEWTRSA